MFLSLLLLCAYPLLYLLADPLWTFVLVLKTNRWFLCQMKPLAGKMDFGFETLTDFFFTYLSCNCTQTLRFLS